MLHVFGAATPERIARSDRICDALQIIEHLQDVGEDYARGRVYLPREDMARFGCGEPLSAQARPCHRCATCSPSRPPGQDRCLPLALPSPGRSRFALGSRLAGSSPEAGLRSTRWSEPAMRSLAPARARHSARSPADGFRRRRDDERPRDRGRPRVRVLRRDHPAGRSQLLLRHPSAPSGQAPGDECGLRVRAPHRRHRRWWIDREAQMAALTDERRRLAALGEQTEADRWDRDQARRRRGGDRPGHPRPWPCPPVLRPPCSRRSSC